MPLLETALIAGAGLAGQGVNMISQGSMNRKTREFSEQMYNRQLEDNKSFWHMQNDYNSPSAQMQRLKQAGLNPNMVYGHGNAIQPATPIKSADTPSWSPNAPRVNLDAPIAQGITAYHDIRMKQATIDNVRTQNNVLAQEAILKAAQTAATIAQTGKTTIDTRLATSLFDNTLEMAKQNLRKLTYEVEPARVRSMFAEENAANESNNIRLMVDKLENDLKLQKIDLKGRNMDNTIKYLDIQLKKNGIQPNDPAYMRILGRLLSNHLNLSNY